MVYPSEIIRSNWDQILTQYCLLFNITLHSAPVFKVTARCGALPPGRQPPRSPSLDPPAALPRYRAPSAAGGSTHPRQPEIRLHAKIAVFVRSLADSKGFYTRLPDELCSSARLAAGSHEACWNGTAVAP